MPTITCQYTGIQFEAPSARSKNHPAVSRLLTEASGDKHHRNRYQVTLEALATVRNENLTDINEVLRRVDYIVTNRLDGQHTAQRQAELQRRQQEQEREARRQARKEQNEYLRRHGYTWSKTYADFDEYEEGEPSQWMLSAADGREVTVAQALDEITRGAEVVLAEIAAREAAESEAKRQAEATKQAELDTFDAIVADAKAGMTQVESLGISSDEMELVGRQVLDYRTTIVLRGTVNGVPVTAIERYTYDHDTFSYWCADPAAAELTPVAKPEPGTLEATFAAFFGE